MVFRVSNPEHYFWKVNAFQSENCLHGYEFSIYVSRHFLDTAAKVEYDKLVAQKEAHRIAVKAGLKISPHHNLLRFGKFGIHQISWPLSGGTWLAIEESSVSDRGANYASHNCDNPQQQSVLMTTWLYWADFIEYNAFTA